MFIPNLVIQRNRSFSYFLSGLIAVLLIITTHAQARVLSYATSSPPTESGVNLALQWWADEIKKRTDGEFEVEVHYMGSLVKLKDAVDGVSSGVADSASVVPAYSQARLPLHYLAATAVGNGDQYVVAEAWMRMYDKFPELKKELDKNNMVHLGHQSNGPQVILSTGKPYYAPSDFNGDKVRLASMWARAAMLQDWNVTPVNLTFPDIYTGLERGTIDGAQSYMNLVIPYRHHEVASHLVEPNIGQHMNIIVMNKRVYDSLPQSTKSVIQELKHEYLMRMAKGDLEDNKDARQELENHPDYPTKVHKLTNEQRIAWQKDLGPSVEETLKKVSQRAEIAPELYEAYHSEIEAVTKEVEENGYPWER